jgi:hypothetical protein
MRFAWIMSALLLSTTFAVPTRTEIINTAKRSNLTDLQPAEWPTYAAGRNKKTVGVAINADRLKR